MTRKKEGKVEQTVRRRRHGTVLPADACPACGTMKRVKRGNLTFPVNGEKIAVPDAVHLRCPKCREVLLRLDEARRLRERALPICREKHGFLSAQEVRSIRERFGSRRCPSRACCA
jgi:YgiT-type zinc finger domain-containing protein